MTDSTSSTIAAARLPGPGSLCQQNAQPGQWEETLVYSNGVGVDDDEIRTGVLSLRKPMILDPYGRILAETWKTGDDRVVFDKKGV